MLSDAQARSAKPKDKPYKLTDGGGLYLHVMPGGSKLWRLKYRYLGKEKLLSFGAYPEVSLAKARKARDAAREKLAEGLNPAAERKAEKARALEAQERTFRRLADQYLEKIEREGRAQSTLEKNKWLLGMASDAFGDMPVVEIKPADILKPLRLLEARGTLETAKRLKTVTGSVMRYGISCGWIDADPTPALRGAIARPTVKSHAAITDPEELGGLLRAIDAFSGQATTRIGLQLMALLHPRPGELRHAKWSEIDLEKAVWTIPADRMKMRRPHRAPLPNAAITLLRELKPLTGHGEYLLPSVRSLKRPISENTFTAALRRMGYTGDDATAHGFRATFSTLANESGLWNPDAIERALAHAEANAVRAAYARSEYWEERVRMADWWAGYIEDLKKSENR